MNLKNVLSLVSICSISFHTVDAIGPVAGVLLGVGTGVGVSTMAGGVDCFFGGTGRHCAGQKKIREEEQRQEKIMLENIHHVDQMHQDDQQFNVEMARTSNGNLLAGSNAQDAFLINNIHGFTGMVNEMVGKQASDLNENLKINQLLQHKILNRGANNAKEMVDLSHQIVHPKKRTQAEYDAIFAS